MNQSTFSRFLALIAGILLLFPLLAAARNTEPGTYGISAYNETTRTDARAQDAKADDILAFHLIYDNTTGTQQTLALQADLADFLYLADLVDLGGGSLSGNTLFFQSLSIAPNGRAERLFRAQIKHMPVGTLDLLLSIPFGQGFDLHVQPNGRVKPGQVKGTYTSPSTGVAETTAMSLAGITTLSAYAWTAIRRRTSKHA